MQYNLFSIQNKTNKEDIQINYREDNNFLSCPWVTKMKDNSINLKFFSLGNLILKLTCLVPTQIKVLTGNLKRYSKS